MAPLESNDVNDWVSHEIGEDDVCNRCGSLDWEDTGKVIGKDELDVENNVVKRRHEFHVYLCLNCGAEFHVPIDKRLKEANQYGSTIQAIELSLMDTENVPVNKVKTIISGITEGQLDPSEGFISKLQIRASAGFDEFTDDLRLELIKRRVVYWDDTVIMTMKFRGCLRFYGDETIAFYAAHMHKDMAGLDEDNVLLINK